jgi:plasmid maintenance system killer protein
VKHKASRKFWQFHDAFPAEIQAAAAKAFSSLKRDPRHPSLQFKKLAGNPYWSVRINDNYRALAVRSGETCAWFWIGTHAEYDAILRQK